MRISYKGIEVEVSAWAKCLVVDAMGGIHEYSELPDLVLLGRGLGHWEIDESVHHTRLVGRGADIGNWTDSLFLINR